MSGRCPSAEEQRQAARASEVLADRKSPLDRRLWAFFTALSAPRSLTGARLAEIRAMEPELVKQLGKKKGGRLVAGALEYRVEGERLRCSLPTGDPP